MCERMPHACEAVPLCVCQRGDVCVREREREGEGGEDGEGGGA